MVSEAVCATTKHQFNIERSLYSEVKYNLRIMLGIEASDRDVTSCYLAPRSITRMHRVQTVFVGVPGQPFRIMVLFSAVATTGDGNVHSSFVRHVSFARSDAACLQ